VTKFSVDELIDNASKRAALSVRGEESFRPALEVLVRDILRSRTLEEGALNGIAAWIGQTLVARLRVEDWFANNPGLALVPVERPLFIMGMPRAGTTLLFNMLRHDPRRRVFWHWEGNREIPPVETEHLHDDPRIAQRVAQVNALIEAGVLQYNAHIEHGDEPAECIWQMGQDFKSISWLVQTQVPEYFEWLMHEADMVAAYAYHKRVLQVLQSRAPGWWTLKLPSHAFGIAALLEVYPDARIVMTHRDPVKPVGSSSRLCEQTLQLRNGRIDRKLMGYQTNEMLALCTERMTAARAANPNVPFHDIHYKAFIADPMEEVRRLYRFIERDLPEPIEAMMQAELDRHNAARGQHEAHRYSLSDYGLTRDIVNERFGDYVERYNIEIEKD
jgi:hypothetical protein